MSEQEIVGTQIISIDPKQYVTAVYAPFRTRLAEAKAAADLVGSVDATTKDGMAVAVKHRAVFRSIRTEAEKARVQRKGPILEISRLIDGRYRELESEIAAYENTFDAAIKAEEQRKQAEKDAALRAERERIEAEQAAIKKAEEERLAAERAAIAAQQAELARKQAEFEAAEKAARDKIEAEQRAARLRIEEQERAARLQREEADRAARLEREAEEARLKAERDKLEAERRAVEEAQRREREVAEAKAKAEREAKELAERKAREEAEAKQREIDRQENELKDGREMLSTFVKRFGKRKEFSPIAAAITAFLGGRQ